MPYWRITRPPGPLACGGTVVEVAPGIGVERLATEDDGYVAFIALQLERIRATRAGRAIIATFDPAQARFALTIAPHHGLTVLISQPRPGCPTRNVNIRTSEWARDTASPTIPRVEFLDRPALGAPAIEIGRAGGARFTRLGVVGHADFPAMTQDFDVVLYHELVHAYLSNRGVGRRLRHARVARTIGNPEQAEEELVVGLLAGRGFALAENAYRCQTNRPIRTSHVGVGLADPRVSPDDWASEISLDEATARWRERKEMPAADTAWIATGRE
jgi:hypothetical protein